MYRIRLLIGSQWRSISKGVMRADFGVLQKRQAEQLISLRILLREPEEGQQGEHCNNQAQREQERTTVLWLAVFETFLFCYIYISLALVWFGKCRALVTENRSLKIFLFIDLFLQHWDFNHGKVRLLSPGKPAATESRYPIWGVCWVFQCFHNPLNSDTDNRISNVRTHVNACNCT